MEMKTFLCILLFLYLIDHSFSEAVSAKSKNSSSKLIKMVANLIFFKNNSIECSEYSRTAHSRNCHHKVSPLLGYRPAEHREFPHTVFEIDSKNHLKLKKF